MTHRHHDHHRHIRTVEELLRKEPFVNKPQVQQPPVISSKHSHVHRR